MALIPKWNNELIAKIIDAKLTPIKQAALTRLQQVGERFVTNARQNGSYKDRTGNLRSSVGYVILLNGQQIDENFQTVSQAASAKVSKKAGQAGKGAAAGKAIATQVAAQYPIGLVLICVAGMEYAAAVESRGYEVISTSGITAKNDLKKSMEELQAKVNKTA